MKIVILLVVKKREFGEESAPVFSAGRDADSVTGNSK